VDYDYEKLANIINKESIGRGRHLIERYKWFLPVEDSDKAISLEEGDTPLIKCRRLGSVLGLENLYIKDETRNSFKDRAITVGITFALQRGYRKVITASTGNAAASLSAYSAKAGVDCLVLIPGEASISKLAQILLYGATIMQVRGTVDAALNLLRVAFEELGWYPIPTSTPFNPYQVEGNKTIAYEICQQNNWLPPDYVIFPVGGGDCIFANWKGFQELYKLGFIDRLPSIIGVQAAGCNPVVKAYREELEDIKPIKFAKTIASSILVSYPPTGLLALRAIRQSMGIALDVTDEEILSVDKNDYVVCVITGTGLKQTEAISSLLEKIKIIEPTAEALKKALYRLQ